MTGGARLSLITLLTAAAGCIATHSQEKQSPVERGKYIVENVAMCEQCHTPRDEHGNVIRSRWLMGGPVQMRPSYPSANWAAVAPRLAGQPPGTDAEVIRLLTSGIWKTGAPPNPPMPPFRMTGEDAQAVVAYLKSLGE
jgi:mono/diheme cytochrome c family protein